jgi:phosphoribosylformylglycinamidine synthase PurS subunit
VERCGAGGAGSIELAMATFEARIEITHRPGILDPQGANVERALPALGYDNVSEVRVGKSIRLVLDAPDAAAAEVQVEEMCRRLLANPVIEHYAIELTSTVEASR